MPIALIHWAGVESREMQNAVVSALFKANFEQGRNVGDSAVLIEIAKEAGLDGALIERLLATDSDKDMITSEIDAAKQMALMACRSSLLTSNMLSAEPSRARCWPTHFGRLRQRRRRHKAN